MVYVLFEIFVYLHRETIPEQSVHFPFLVVIARLDERRLLSRAAAGSRAQVIACNPSYLGFVCSISFINSLLLKSHGCDVIEWVSHNMDKLHLGARSLL